MFRPMIVVGCAMAFVLLLTCSNAMSNPNADTLEQRLYEIDQMRAHDRTPFDAVERQAKELLSIYSTPVEQGLIYYTIAEVFAQSGQVRPDKTIEYAAKAWELPLDPVRKMQLAIYWGDAIQVAHQGVRGTELAEARRKAAVPYLNGIRIAVEEEVPYEELSLPEGMPVPNCDGPGSADAQKRYLAHMKQRAHIRTQIRMMQHREVLVDQIVFLYSRMPFAPTEVRTLSQDIVQDERTVNYIVSKVNAYIRTRIDDEFGAGRLLELPPDLVPSEPGHDAGISRLEEGDTKLPRRKEHTGSGDVPPTALTFHRNTWVIGITALAGTIILMVMLRRKMAKTSRRTGTQK